MPLRSATLPLDGSDPLPWMTATLQGWGLPSGLARTWMPAVRQGLASGRASEVRLEHDDAMGLASVEVRGPDGAVLIGLDDLVGSF